MTLDPATVWITCAGMTAVTVALRLSFLVLPPSVVLPPLLARALRYVPAAVLTCIWAPELLLQKGVLHVALDNEKLLAGIVAIAVAWIFRRTYVTIFAGLAALHLFAWLLHGTP